MVRFKSRYLQFRFIFPEPRHEQKGSNGGRNPRRPITITVQTLSKLFRQQVQTEFGDYGAGLALQSLSGEPWQWPV